MAWELILKSPTDKQWQNLIKRIRNDELPTDRTKYVKYSMLDDITKRMVEYYFKRGINHPKFRDACIKGILEEMLRSSNVRFEVEDRSKGE